MKTLLLSMMFIPLILKMCSGAESSDDRVRLAKVDNEIIYLDEAVEGMPVGLSSKDSVEFIQQFLENRTKELLMYNQAQEDLPNGNNIDELVEDYRRSLVIFAFQQELMNKKMQKSINDSMLLSFYESNKSRFLTSNDLVKGIFIKVHKSAPGLEKIRRIYKNNNSDAFQKIETFCVQNNGHVEYFFDHWVLFADLLSSASYEISNTSDFLRNHSSLDVVVGDYEYLLYIEDFKLAGSTAPFEYVKEEVKTVVTNTNKTEFLHSFEQELFLKAKKKGRITYYNETRKN